MTRLVGLLSSLLLCASAAPLLGDLRVEGLSSPLALAAPSPRFSWRVGGIQTSYRITVSTSYPTSSILWDTGVVQSNNSWLIPYGGASPLPTGADMTWAVTTQLTGVGFVSADATFSTAPSSPLPGAWLGFADTLRGTISLDAAPVARARLHVTGVGCYVALVNGERISSPLSPGFGHAPSARALYDTYDVARLLRAGENAVGVRVGSCKWGAFGQYCEGTAAQCNAAWAVLIIDQGGNVTTLASDAASWVASNASIISQHLWNGELFDARLEEEGWAAPGFANASTWAPATVVDTADRIGPLLPSTAPPIDPGAPITPLSVTMPSTGAFVFDLGADIAGSCGINLDAPAGEVPAGAGLVVSLLHAELLYANGSVYNHYLPPGGTHQPNGLNQPQMNYTYVTRGGGSEVARGPHFSFFGFRFIEMRGWPFATPPTRDALVCSFIHSDLPPTGAVAFPSSPLLTKLQEATLRTHLSNYVSLPTDCPQREKRGWTGDAQLTVKSGLLNFEALAFYESWHTSILDQQRIGCLPPGETPGRVGGVAGAPIRPANWACDPPKALPNLKLGQYQFGPVSDVVPREQLGMGYFIGDPSWEVAATTIPYELLTSLGDVRYVADNYDGPSSLLAFFNNLGQYDPATAGLINWSYLGDWVAIDTPNNKLVANSNYVLAAMQAAELASAAGRPADATKYLALASLLSDAMRDKFWNVSMKVPHWDTGSQSAQALCLALGIGGENIAAAGATALLNALAAANGHLTVGASGAQVLLRTLADVMSRPDVALALVSQTSYPSWGFFLSGAVTNGSAANQGTYWEAWDTDAIHGGSSLNHIFKAGGISPYLFETALGLKFAAHPAAHDATSPCPTATCALSVLGDSRARFGLDCAHATALCGVIADAHTALATGARGVTSLASLSAAVASHIPTATAMGSTRSPVMQYRIGMSISSASVTALGAARGWRATPAGNASLEWVADSNALRVSLTAPAGGETWLELPLPAAAPARIVIDGAAAAVVEVDAAGGVRGTGATAVWAPTVEPCAGVVAARVDGRRAPATPHAGVCARVLTLVVPAGAHTLELQ